MDALTPVGIGRRCMVLVRCGDTHLFGCEVLALRVDPLTPVGIGTSCMVLVWCGIAMSCMVLV